MNIDKACLWFKEQNDSQSKSKQVMRIQKHHVLQTLQQKQNLFKGTLRKSEGAKTQRVKYVASGPKKKIPDCRKLYMP